MAITVRTPVGSNNAGGGTSIVVTYPTGTAANDVLVVCVTVRGGTGTTITPPTANGTWTLLNRSNSGTTLAQATLVGGDAGLALAAGHDAARRVVLRERRWREPVPHVAALS